MTALSRLFRGAFLILFGIVVCILLLQNGAFAGLAAALGAMILCFRSKTRRFGLWLFLGCLATRILFVLLIETPVVSDFYVMLSSARQWAAGSMEFADNIYYKLWGYQLPFTAWEALLLSIWNSEFFIKLMNCLFMAGSNLLVYLISRVTWSEQASRSAAGLYFVLLFPLTMASVLTNQHISAFFLLLAVWLLLEPRLKGLRFGRWPLAGLSAALGHAFRSEGSILLVALGAYGVFWLLRERKDLLSRLKTGAPRAVALVLVYAVVLSGIGALMNVTGANQNGDGISNTNPLWKFVVGFNHDTGGTFSQDDSNAMFSIAAPANGWCQELEDMELELIRERLSVSPIDMAKLMLRKLWRLWARSEMYWAFGHWDLSRPILMGITYGDVYSLMEEYDLASRVPLYLLALLGVWYLVKRKKPEELSGYLPPFVVFAAFCAFLLVEVQGRYSYLPLLFLACTAAGGIQAAGEWIQRKIR